MAEEAKKTAKKQKEAEIVAETVNEEVAPEIIVEKEVVEAPKPKATAKAGKRSSKAQKEAEEKQAKEERKAEAGAEEPKSKSVAKTRTKAERAGKKYREAAKLVEKDKLYSLNDALDLATKTSVTKFDATVELHINLGVDPRQADQNVRDTVSLPAGTGKDVRVATLASDADAEILFAKLDKEEIDFDILVATPNMMPKLGKYARLLGPRGLMPNPKSGTVTTEVEAAVQEAKAGRVEYRVDQAGIVHIGIGKVSFGAAKLNQNAEAVMASIRAARPASLKGNYIKAITVSTTMGPGIKVETSARS
jgi:large subunit ribosomal protein L1